MSWESGRLNSCLQVEAVQSKPPPRTTVNTTGMSKLQARRIQMLVKQREREEQELAALEAEVEALVRISPLTALSV